MLGGEERLDIAAELLHRFTDVAAP